jgi:ATP-dependent protease ClpP protease subunit
LKQTIHKRFGSEVSPNSLPFSVRATQEVHTHYICDVFGELENLSDIEDTLFVLGIAEENDTVTIRLNSGGGAHIVGDALIMAMNKCQAPVHVIASGLVASYATFILLQADSFEISPFTDILCHCMSFGYGGKMKDTKEAVDFIHKQGEKLLKYYYDGFFTEEELQRIIEGHEHWMDADEFVQRFTARQEYLSMLLDIESQQSDEQFEN